MSHRLVTMTSQLLALKKRKQSSRTSTLCLGIKFEFKLRRLPLRHLQGSEDNLHFEIVKLLRIDPVTKSNQPLASVCRDIFFIESRPWSRRPSLGGPAPAALAVRSSGEARRAWSWSSRFQASDARNSNPASSSASTWWRRQPRFPSTSPWLSTSVGVSCALRFILSGGTHSLGRRGLKICGHRAVPGIELRSRAWVG